MFGNEIRNNQMNKQIRQNNRKTEKQTQKQKNKHYYETCQLHLPVEGISLFDPELKIIS